MQPFSSQCLWSLHSFALSLQLQFLCSAQDVASPFAFVAVALFPAKAEADIANVQAKTNVEILMIPPLNANVRAVCELIKSLTTGFVIRRLLFDPSPDRWPSRR